MNGPADRSVRLLLIMAGTVLSYDTFRLVSRWGIETVPVNDLAVHVNFDPPERLRLLPGVGPVIARQVVEERNRRPFEDSEDFVDRVRGIGPAFVANFGNWLRFDREADTIAMQRGDVIDQERLP
jgi:hypothetical protein